MTAADLGYFDVVVVGAGTGGLCVAIEAAAGGASVYVGGMSVTPAMRGARQQRLRR
ncbi:hypothetical protein ACQP1K_16070 [Sphaerimonospora sp. CA-214678]|uniref:hypothetical protein n=1 Tax=Sphaerimonospora sp. CA-214678 TaxID=3240029 RepID=UPI003D8A6D85